MTDAQKNLAGSVLVAATVTTAIWIADGTSTGLAAAAILGGFVLLIELGRRRSDALAAISGVGDERSRTLNVRAVAFAGNVMALVIVGWFVIRMLQDKDTTILGTLASIFGVSYIGAAIYYARSS